MATFTLLLLILQRYYFESESQQVPCLYSVKHRCCLSYKDTILKANHSRFIVECKKLDAVAYPTKILFWKRITAQLIPLARLLSLLLILQRYYFESESQPNMILIIWLSCCCLSYKDTILKANHSEDGSHVHGTFAVAYPTKILFWKRITAGSYPFLTNVCCCLSYKDTILKANHSILLYMFKSTKAVAYPTKILFWKRITAEFQNSGRW